MSKKKHSNKTIDAAFKQLFDQTKPEACVAIAHLANYCYLFRTTMAIDPLEMANAEGKREVMLHILKLVEIDYGQLSEIMKAHKEEN